MNITPGRTYINRAGNRRLTVVRAVAMSELPAKIQSVGVPGTGRIFEMHETTNLYGRNVKRQFFRESVLQDWKNIRKK